MYSVVLPPPPQCTLHILSLAPRSLPSPSHCRLPHLLQDLGHWPCWDLRQEQQKLPGLGPIWPDHWRAYFFHNFQTLRMLGRVSISLAQRLVGTMLSHIRQTLANKGQDRQEHQRNFLPCHPKHTPIDCSRQGSSRTSIRRCLSLSFFLMIAASGEHL